MAAFYDNDITNNGRQLISELFAGAEFRPTKIVVGSGYLPSSVTTRTITAVVTPVKQFSVNKSEKLPDGNFVFGGIFTNEDITTDFEFRELGLYAKAILANGTETDEILYSYGNAGSLAETIPAYGTSTVIEREMNIITYIGNDTEVNLEIASGITVSKSEFDAEISRIDIALGSINTALGNKVDKVPGKGLSTNDYTTEEKNKVANLPADTNAELGKKGNIQGFNTGFKVVNTSDWKSYSLGQNIKFRAQISDERVTSDMIAEVYFIVSAVDTGVLSPVCATQDGAIDIYAAEKPSSSITIDNIRVTQVLS